MILALLAEFPHPPLMMASSVEFQHHQQLIQASLAEFPHPPLMMASSVEFPLPPQMMASSVEFRHHQQLMMALSVAFPLPPQMMALLVEYQHHQRSLTGRRCLVTSLTMSPKNSTGRIWQEKLARNLIQTYLLKLQSIASPPV